MDKSLLPGGIHRDNYQMQIMIRRPNHPGKLLSGEEVKRYDIVTSNFPAKFSVEVVSNFLCKDEEISDRIQTYSLTVEADQKSVVDFGALLKEFCAVAGELASPEVYSSIQLEYLSNAEDKN